MPLHTYLAGRSGRAQWIIFARTLILRLTFWGGFAMPPRRRRVIGCNGNGDVRRSALMNVSGVKCGPLNVYFIPGLWDIGFACGSTLVYFCRNCRIESSGYPFKVRPVTDGLPDSVLVSSPVSAPCTVT